MKYSIVIPTYNHCEDLLKPCIESIFKYTDMTDVELVISANGCTDGTSDYLEQLKNQFENIGFGSHLKVVWHDKPLGYAVACNEGILVTRTDKIVLLNNDVILLPQAKSQWLQMLDRPFDNINCGISGVIKGPSEPAGREFIVFFCVMIKRRVFSQIGLLSTEFGVGGGEDTEFCIRAESYGYEVSECSEKIWDGTQYTGVFPIYHKGEGTMHDPTLVPDWSNIFLRNSLKLAKKYNRDWYRWKLSNHAERGVFLKGDAVYPREAARYTWAAKKIKSGKVLEIGCSSGFGVQFLPVDIAYTGIDYDPMIIEAANEQGWGSHAQFLHADINMFELGQYDTIIAFEVIEHLSNGLELLERLKKHCKTLLFTVPFNEPPGSWSPHHKLHYLTQTNFPGFTCEYLQDDGRIASMPGNQGANLLLGSWQANQDLKWICDLGKDAKELFEEVIRDNVYQVSEDNLRGRSVIDIGANIGAFSMFAASLGASKVVAVEPVSSTFNTLIHNIGKANADQIVVPKKAVVLEKDDLTVSIGLNPNCGHNSLYQAQIGSESVSSVSLKSLLNMVDGDDVFLKIDCEGAEYDILMNASSEDMNRVSTLAMEVHLDMHPTYRGLDVIEKKLQAFGLKLSDRKQLGAWDFDAQGNMINYRPLPVTNEIWVRA